MSNIIEQRIKLNMKTETRKERTPNTPMMADCCASLLLPLGLHGLLRLFLPSAKNMLSIITQVRVSNPQGLIGPL